MEICWPNSLLFWWLFPGFHWVRSGDSGYFINKNHSSKAARWREYLGQVTWENVAYDRDCMLTTVGLKQ